MPVLHVIVGPNGVGRTTLYRTLLAQRYPGLPFANTVESCDALLVQGIDFAVRMLFTRPSELEVLARARALGFSIVLYVVCVDAPWLLLDRERQPTAEGDDDVSPRKIIAHHPQTLSLLREGVAFADVALLFDGSEVEHGGPALVASVAGGRMHFHTALRPRWVEKVLGFSED